MTPPPDRKQLAQELDAIARSIDPNTIEAEMGPMCHQSFFQLLHGGAPLTQQAIDEATQAFGALTLRLMPPPLVCRFIAHTTSMRLLPEIERADLVPGFSSSEDIAGGDAATRLASPMKKFTKQEALDCLAWNQAHPENPLAVAHLIHLVDTYVDGLRQVVSRYSPEAAAKLVPFARQWAPKNVLKFVNIALFVTGRKKAQSLSFTIDQALIEEAMDLLNHAGAFTWDVAADPKFAAGEPLKIHCPAHAFLHKLIVREGALLTVLDFVREEVSRKPPAAEMTKALLTMERLAISEETGIRTFGQEWSQMKLEA